MSIQEAERFNSDVKIAGPLQAEVKAKATGLAAVVEIARTHGYNFTFDEARDLIRNSSVGALTDGRLGLFTSVSSVVQTTTVASSVVEAAEVVTSAVQVTEAAADVAAAAEAVVVVAAVLI